MFVQGQILWSIFTKKRFNYKEDIPFIIQQPLIAPECSGFLNVDSGDLLIKKSATEFPLESPPNIPNYNIHFAGTGKVSSIFMNLKIIQILWEKILLVTLL
jgi:hypothetical protein